MENNKRPTEQLKDIVLTKKTKLPLSTIFHFHLPASMQNTLRTPNWRKGDPNDETSPDYDLVWLVWVLRQVFPKDIITHFINLNGGFSFTLYRCLEIAGVRQDPMLQLTFWKETGTTLCNWRNIYFNLPLEKIKRTKGRTYIWHKDGKSYYVEE
jgi:hypothetical protein